jgi:hypothetical protein
MFNQNTNIDIRFVNPETCLEESGTFIKLIGTYHVQAKSSATGQIYQVDTDKVRDIEKNMTIAEALAIITSVEKPFTVVEPKYVTADEWFASLEFDFPKTSSSKQKEVDI